MSYVNILDNDKVFFFLSPGKELIVVNRVTLVSCRKSKQKIYTSLKQEEEKHCFITQTVFSDRTFFMNRVIWVHLLETLW